MKYSRLDELLDTVSHSLKSVQVEFDEYQKKHFPKRSSEFFCLELNGEAGELANLEKKAWKGRQIETDLFADEAADVLISLMNYSNAKGINLGEAVKYKLQKIDSIRIELESKGEKY